MEQIKHLDDKSTSNQSNKNPRLIYFFSVSMFSNVVCVDIFFSTGLTYMFAEPMMT